MDEQNQLVVDGADLVSHPKKATGAKTMPSQPTMRTLPVLAFAVLLGPILASSPSPSTVNDDRLDPRQDEALEGDVGRMTNASTAAAGVAAADRCGLWLAPSTIPGAGLGMFAGKEYDENDPIGPPDLVIPVVDYHAHNPENEDEIIFDYYGWNTFSFAHVENEGMVDGESISFCPGAGAALNCVLGLVNTVGSDELVLMDQAGLHRSKDPGAGAFTPFYNRQLLSRGGIKAGDELFDSYGDAYFETREAVFGMIPLTSDHKIADELLSNYFETKSSVCQISTPKNQNCVTIHSDWYGLLLSLTSLWPSRILNALPTDSEKVERIKDLGTAYNHYDRSHRSLDWLDENGLCMDNIEIRPSTIPQAGRGAFARRFLREGTEVGPAPVIHVPRHLLSMHPFVYRRGHLKIDDAAEPSQHQLVLNYCWGHRHSSVVLCPYGSVIPAINHSKEKANAKLRWNTKLMQHPEWLSMPVADWVGDLHSGLVLDFVATRDIEPGEEILVHYGDEWEEAWTKHTELWRPPEGAISYVDAVRRNEQEQVLRTVSEGHYDEKYTRLHCRHPYLAWFGIDDHDDEEDDSDDDQDEKKEEDDRTQKKLYPCRVISKEVDSSGEYWYTAELTTTVVQAKQTELQVDGILLRVPRDAFVFVDESLSRDHYQPWVFRHDARLPDDIFPVEWKDLL